MNSSQDTPINLSADNTNAILDAIAGLRQEMNQRFNNVEARLRFVEDEIKEVKERLTAVETRATNIETRTTNIETHVKSNDARLAHIESEFFSFNVRLKRVEAMSHEAVSIGKNLEADTMIVKAEVLAWSQDVMNLQRKVA